jgi:hypothetical protein
MIPRKRLDIGWTDLLFGFAACLWPGSRERMRQRLERLWSPEGHGLACLSVRSAFDALLSVLGRMGFSRSSFRLGSTSTLQLH